MTEKTKVHELYTQISSPTDGSLLPCPCCGSEPEIWRYSTAKDAPSTPVVMCSNGDRFGPQDGLAHDGCLLYMPPDNFYRPTIREAVKYWNEYAKALELQQRKNRWETASVLRNGTEEAT